MEDDEDCNGHCLDCDGHEACNEEANAEEASRSTRKNQGVTITGLNKEDLIATLDGAIANLLGGSVQRNLNERIENAIQKAITERIEPIVNDLVREQLRPIIAGLIESGWEATDRYGNPKGATSVRALVTNFLEAKSGSSYSDSPSNAAALVSAFAKDMVPKVLKDELAAKIEACKADVVAYIETIKGKAKADVDKLRDGAVVEAVRRVLDADKQPK